MLWLKRENCIESMRSMGLCRRIALCGPRSAMKAEGHGLKQDGCLSLLGTIFGLRWAAGPAWHALVNRQCLVLHTA